MPEQLLDLVEGAAGVDDVTSVGVPEHVGGDPPVQPCPAGQARDQIAQRVRWHRRPERLAEQVDQHEVTRLGLEAFGSLEDVLVVCLNDQEVNRDGPLATRLGPRPVDVVTPHHV